MYRFILQHYNKDEIITHSNEVKTEGEKILKNILLTSCCNSFKGYLNELFFVLEEKFLPYCTISIQRPTY